MCGQWRHGERRRWGWLCFGIGLFSFFSLSFLWFYGLLTGSRLSSGYERRSLADFCQGLQEERDLQQGSCAGPDDPGRGNLQVLGQFNTPGWPIKV